MNSICYAGTEANCNSATQSTNMSQASAGTDASYYGAAATPAQVAAAAASNTCGSTVLAGVNNALAAEMPGPKSGPSSSTLANTTSSSLATAAGGAFVAYFSSSNCK